MDTSNGVDDDGAKARSNIKPNEEAIVALRGDELSWYERMYETSECDVAAVVLVSINLPTPLLLLINHCVTCC